MFLHDWIQFFLSIFAIVFLILSGICAFRAYRMETLDTIPHPENMKKIYQSNNYLQYNEEKFYKVLCTRYAGAFNNIFIVNGKKTKCLTLSYYLVFLAVWSWMLSNMDKIIENSIDKLFIWIK